MSLFFFAITVWIVIAICTFVGVSSGRWKSHVYNGRVVPLPVVYFTRALVSLLWPYYLLLAFLEDYKMGSNVGKVNRYTCTTCRQFIVTKDVDRGTTPMFIHCRATEGCTGLMHSEMYRVPQTLRHGYEWYKPHNLRVLSDATREHVEQGGLLLREKNHVLEAR